MNMTDKEFYAGLSPAERALDHTLRQSLRVTEADIAALQEAETDPELRAARARALVLRPLAPPCTCAICRLPDGAARLISATRAEEIFLQQISELKAAVMLIPKRAKSLMPHLTDDAVRVLEDLCRECCDAIDRIAARPRPRARGRRS